MSPQASNTPPLLPSLAPQRRETEFTPLPGYAGPSPFRQAEAAVADFKAEALTLLARGEAVLAHSNTSSPKVDAFRPEALTTMPRSPFRPHDRQ